MKQRMSTSEIPYVKLCWNPGGCGCSRRCDGCWAIATGKRMACPDCRAFRTHFHPERLTAPERRKKPATIGVQFTGDLFDPQRDIGQIVAVLDAMRAAPWHTYVLLSQQPELMRGMLEQWCKLRGLPRLPDNWYVGATVRDQTQYDATMPHLASIPGRVWLSLEPLSGPIDLRLCDRQDPIRGNEDSAVGYDRCSSGKHWSPMFGGPWCGVECVVVGHDNRASAAGTDTLANVFSVVSQCVAAGVPVYVKQLWFEKGGKRRLYHDPSDFPPVLQRRELAWPTPEDRS